jgi:hypothetical protein
MKKTISKRPVLLDNIGNNMHTTETIFNMYNDPIDFMMDVKKEYAKTVSDKKTRKTDLDRMMMDGVDAFDNTNRHMDAGYDKLYEDVAEKVKSKLISRGFTTKLLYETVEFTTERTGMLSRQRLMLGYRDHWFKYSGVGDGDLFHDIFINLSYSYSHSEEKIRNNSYALYALTKALSRLIPIRVIVVNWVSPGLSQQCYSYYVKKFGQPIDPHKFLFFTSDSKRTFGWSHNMLVKKTDSLPSIGVGRPNGTVSIADLNLDKEINKIWDKLISKQEFRNQLWAH